MVEPSELFTSTFLFTANYTGENLSGEISFKKLGEEKYEIAFFAPENLTGYSVYAEGETVTLDYMGIKSERGICELPDEHPLRAITHAIYLSQYGQATRNETGAGDEVFTFPDGTKITLFAGVVKEIAVPAAKATFKISGFEKI